MPDESQPLSPNQTPSGTTILHASCVAYSNKAILITGQSGSGKSALALQLMALGAKLIADDRTALTRVENALRAECPKTISGLIEVRGMGILRADPSEPANVALVVDLDRKSAERLPKPQTIELLDFRLPLVSAIEGPHFAAALLQFLTHGRHDT